MKLIDTHAHIYEAAFSEDLEQVVQRSRENHVHAIYMPNIDSTTIERMLATEMKYPDLCYAMMGIHPCYIKQDFEKQLEQVAHWLSKRSFAAIGEIGIDLYHDRTWKKEHVLSYALHCKTRK